jgi:hypothetical protein
MATRMAPGATPSDIFWLVVGQGRIPVGVERCRWRTPPDAWHPPGCMKCKRPTVIVALSLVLRLRSSRGDASGAPPAGTRPRTAERLSGAGPKRTTKGTKAAQPGAHPESVACSLQPGFNRKNETAGPDCLVY